MSVNSVFAYSIAALLIPTTFFIFLPHASLTGFSGSRPSVFSPSTTTLPRALTPGSRLIATVVPIATPVKVIAVPSAATGPATGAVPSAATAAAPAANDVVTGNCIAISSAAPTTLLAKLVFDDEVKAITPL